MSTLYRSSLLAVANFKPLRTFIERRGPQLGVRRFVAGETFPEADQAITNLEQQGFHVILDLLGEFLDDEEAVQKTTDDIVATVQQLGNRQGNGHLSVKLTQLGLGISQAHALTSMRRVAQAADDAGIHVCMDMENHPYVDGTLEILETLRAEGLTNVSTVLQAYLHRTPDDLERLLRLSDTQAIRIVKGAYKEPATIAHQDRAVISQQFGDLIMRTLEAGGYANIASHDEQLIRQVLTEIKARNLSNDKYEFQMLYGVMPGLQKSLLKEGHRVRVYVPFGQDWYGYFSRRLAEKPGNLAFVVRGLFG